MSTDASKHIEASKKYALITDMLCIMRTLLTSDHDNENAHTNKAIRNVKSWPMITKTMYINKVNDGSFKNTVYQVSARATNNAAKSEAL